MEILREFFRLNGSSTIEPVGRCQEFRAQTDSSELLTYIGVECAGLLIYRLDLLDLLDMLDLRMADFHFFISAV
jgi:hypothetical protein